MNIFYGPLEFLTAFALVLAAGILSGFGLGWHFCGHFRTHSLRTRH
jgi:hypothetical protein